MTESGARGERIQGWGERATSPRWGRLAGGGTRPTMGDASEFEVDPHILSLFQILRHIFYFKYIVYLDRIFIYRVYIII